MSLQKDDVKWPVGGTGILELEDQSEFRSSLVLKVGEWTADTLSLERSLSNRGFLLDDLSILGRELLWCLVWISDLEHWIGLLFFTFTLGAKIKIRSNTALIPDTFNRINIAAIADKSCMDNLLLL